MEASGGHSSVPGPFDQILEFLSLESPQPPRPASKVSARRVMDAIIEALYPISAHELGDECVRLGLAPQGDGEDPPMTSKRAYVRRRLLSHSLEQLPELATRVNDDFETADLSQLLTLAGARGVDGELKNLIFAANGPKPKIVPTDAVSNVIQIVENAEFCLVYDRPLGYAGLSWRQMVHWWAEDDSLEGDAERQAGLALYERLLASMADNEAEQLLFREYARLYRGHGFDIPALIPQVYLHYDPYSRGAGGTLTRQRMDFLLLLPGQRRVVLELDGKQHYAREDGTADPARYAEMVREDRRLRLQGYEVYRFGGLE